MYSQIPRLLPSPSRPSLPTTALGNRTQPRRGRPLLAVRAPPPPALRRHLNTPTLPRLPPPLLEQQLADRGRVEHLARADLGRGDRRAVLGAVVGRRGEQVVVGEVAGCGREGVGVGGGGAVERGARGPGGVGAGVRDGDGRGRRCGLVGGCGVGGRCVGGRGVAGGARRAVGGGGC